MADVFVIVAERDRDYFRKTREERFGTPLEAVQANRASDVVGFGGLARSTPAAEM